MEIAARIIGVFLLLIWIFYISVARKTLRTRDSLLITTIFQFNILPFIVGFALIYTGKLLVLIGIPVLWISAFLFPNFTLYIFPLVFGWVYGTMISSDIFSGSRAWYYGGGVLGVLAMFLICTVIVAFITTPSD